jgi:hypothetical protein
MLATVRLSYLELPSFLRRSFARCSSTPGDRLTCVRRFILDLLNPRKNQDMALRDHRSSGAYVDDLAQLEAISALVGCMCVCMYVYVCVCSALVG